MNVFSENAYSELKRLGLQPFPILHVSETSMRQPMRPVTLKLRLNSEIERNENFHILCGDINDVSVEANSKPCQVGNDSISVQLHHFSE